MHKKNRVNLLYPVFCFDTTAKKRSVSIKVTGVIQSWKYKSGNIQLLGFISRQVLPGIVEEIRPHPWKNTKLSQLNHIKLLQALIT